MAGPVIILKPLKAPHFDLKGIRSRLLGALRDEGTYLRADMLKTTRTWKDKPMFQKDNIATKDQLGILVTPNLGTPAGMHWLYLDAGTKIRWAVMSSDWRSKTKVRWIGSGPGRGRAVIYGRRAMQQRNIAARPGIKARKWSELIERRRAPKFEARMKREFGLLAERTIKT